MSEQFKATDTVDRDIVIVGGGIVGAAVAWHLGRLGQAHRVLLLEQTMPMAGATSRAAALVTLLRKDPTLVRLAQETIEAVQHFEQKDEGSTGYRSVGSLHVLPEHLSSLLDDAIAQCETMGVRMEWVSHAFTKQRAPWLQLPQGAKVLHVPDDFFVDPFQLGMAFLRGAQAAGALVRSGCAVTGLSIENDAIVGVSTQRLGHIPARSVVIAAGAWSNLLAEPISEPLPMAPVRSQYWITSKTKDVLRNGAIVFLPEIRAYARPEVSGLLFGLRETQCVVADPRDLPADLSGFAFGSDDSQGWESLSAGAAGLGSYWPGLKDAEIAHYVCGPSNYTPDGHLVVGPAKAVNGLWVASGCSGSGVTFSSGMGRVIAEMLLDVTPTFVNARPMALDRFGMFDPYARDFLEACAAARSGKTSG